MALVEHTGIKVGRRRLKEVSSLQQEDMALRRLTRLTDIEREHGYKLNEQGLRLLRGSIFKAYCQCKELGILDKAGLIVNNGE